MLDSLFGRTEFITFILPFLSRFGFSITLHLFWTFVMWFVWVPFILRFTFSVALIVLWLPYVELRLEENNTESDGDIQIMTYQDKDGKSQVKISKIIDGEIPTVDTSCKANQVLFWEWKLRKEAASYGLSEIIKKICEVKIILFQLQTTI